MNKATGKLLALLEERGVTSKMIPFELDAIAWQGDICKWVAVYDEDEEAFAVAVYENYLSAEQAIAATLGSDASAVRLAERLRSIADEMRNVGASSMTTHELLACYASDVDKVADLLTFAATLGSGTCEDLGGIGANGKEVFHCSKCGCILSLFDSDGMNTLCTSFICDYPRFCPECGCKVVSA